MLDALFCSRQYSLSCRAFLASADSYEIGPHIRQGMKRYAKRSKGGRRGMAIAPAQDLS